MFLLEFKNSVGHVRGYKLNWLTQTFSYKLILYKFKQWMCILFIWFSSIYCSLCIMHSNIFFSNVQSLQRYWFVVAHQKALCYPSILFNYIQLLLCHRWVRTDFQRPDKFGFKSQPYPSSLYDLIQIILHKCNIICFLSLIYTIIIKIPNSSSV